MDSGEPGRPGGAAGAVGGLSTPPRPVRWFAVLLLFHAGGAAATAGIRQIDPCKAYVGGRLVNLEPLTRPDHTPSLYTEYKRWNFTFSPCRPYNLPLDPHTGLGDQCLYVAMCKWRTHDRAGFYYTMGIQHGVTFLPVDSRLVSTDWSVDPRPAHANPVTLAGGTGEEGDATAKGKTRNDTTGVVLLGAAGEVNGSRSLDVMLEGADGGKTTPATSPPKKPTSEEALDRAPYAVAILRMTGIKMLRHQHALIFLVCDVTRVSATAAAFGVLEPLQPTHDMLFELRHLCCCPGACPNGTSYVTLQLAGEYQRENGITALKNVSRFHALGVAEAGSTTDRTVPRFLWLIIIVNICIVLVALAISNLCGRKGDAALSGPYNCLPAIHGRGLSIGMERLLNPDQKRPLTVLDYAAQEPTRLPALNNCVVPRQQLTLGQRLGGGLFCDTYVAAWRERRVAAKRITVGVHKSSLGLQEGKWLADEITVMSHQKHRNLVQILGICLETREPYILTEFIAGESLKDLLSPHSKVVMTFVTKIKMCMQSADGMAYLHSAKIPILHRDLRCSNIMVDVNGHAKVVDFGHTRLVQKFRQECAREECFCQKEQSAFPASLRWTAPEILMHPTADETDRETFTRACDVYSYGVVLWEVATSKDPFDDVIDENEVRELVLKGARPSTDCLQAVLLQYVDLMEVCWSHNSRTRPHFKEVIGHLKVILQAAKSLSSTRRRLSSAGSRQFLRSVRSLASSGSRLDLPTERRLACANTSDSTNCCHV